MSAGNAQSPVPLSRKSMQAASPNRGTALAEVPSTAAEMWFKDILRISRRIQQNSRRLRPGVGKKPHRNDELVGADGLVALISQDLRDLSLVLEYLGVNVPLKLKHYLDDCKRTVTDLVANLQIVKTDAVITGGDCLRNLTENTRVRSLAKYAAHQAQLLEDFLQPSRENTEILTRFRSHRCASLPPEDYQRFSFLSHGKYDRTQHARWASLPPEDYQRCTHSKSPPPRSRPRDRKYARTRSASPITKTLVPRLDLEQMVQINSEKATNTHASKPISKFHEWMDGHARPKRGIIHPAPVDAVATGSLGFIKVSHPLSVDSPPATGRSELGVRERRSELGVREQGPLRVPPFDRKGVELEKRLISGKPVKTWLDKVGTLQRMRAREHRGARLQEQDAVDSIQLRLFSRNYSKTLGAHAAVGSIQQRQNTVHAQTQTHKPMYDHTLEQRAAGSSAVYPADSTHELVARSRAEALSQKYTAAVRRLVDAPHWESSQSSFPNRWI